MLISVVIPTLNEAARIEGCLRQFEFQPGSWELLVVDGGSLDGTAHLAGLCGARVIRAATGRGTQMNAGVSDARGEHLLFLHADATLPADAHASILRVMSTKGVALGCFCVRHEAERWKGTWKVRLLRIADWRSRRTSWPYGDQGLFCRLRDFLEVGGYPDVALMEELGLVKRLRAKGRVVTAPAEISVSARRFEAAFFKSLLCMNTFPILNRLGVGTDRLARWYGAPR